MNAEAYLAQLQALLPSGVAWPREPEAVLTRLLAAWAEELARVDRRAGDLLREADPRATLELLPDWERVAGLPDACAPSAASTIQERRAALVARLTSTGGQSVAYFRDLAAALGYDAIEITEYRPFTVGRSTLGLAALNGGAEVRLVWRVVVPDARVTWFRAGASTLGADPLARLARAEDLECLLTRLAPAHTQLIIAYQGV